MMAKCLKVAKTNAINVHKAKNVNKPKAQHHKTKDSGHKLVVAVLSAAWLNELHKFLELKLFAFLFFCC